jgi:four helix bundle protein
MIDKKKFDLEERTAKFGESVIKLCKTLKQDTISMPIINQIIRSSTSIGANYCEANGASSKKDFKNKIYICKKEAQETKHWLRMLVAYNPEKREECRNLWQETQELTLIFGKIISTLKNYLPTGRQENYNFNRNPKF